MSLSERGGHARKGIDGNRGLPSIDLPGPGKSRRRYFLKGVAPVSDVILGSPTSRDVYAAAHTVVDPWSETGTNDSTQPHIDWDSTMAFRHHLWSLGLGVADAMDTAQRGGGLTWPLAKELIRRSGTEARSVGGRLVCGVNTDQLEPGLHSLATIQDAYLEQMEWAEQWGATPVLMASRHLATAAIHPEEYLRTYDDVLDRSRGNVMLHWLGAAFDPALNRYWGTADIDEAEETVLDILQRHRARVVGVKVSLLDPEREVRLRRRLPGGVSMYTGDDFNYVALIEGDEQGHSDALLGVFDAIALPARAALHALDNGDLEGYRRVLEPTLPLARHMFCAPTANYKTGVVFVAWLNGHQDAFRLLNGAESARSVQHLVELFVLADQANALTNPEMAVARMQSFLRVAGFES
jgi:hypothetical protein